MTIIIRHAKFNYQLNFQIRGNTLQGDMLTYKRNRITVLRSHSLRIIIVHNKNYYKTGKKREVAALLLKKSLILKDNKIAEK